MERNVIIGGKEVKFKSSAAIPHIYRRKFGRDIFLDMARLEEKAIKQPDGSSIIDVESLEMFENLAYTFCKHADPSIPDDIEKWLEQFETFDIYDVLPEIISLWNLENKSISKLKKKSGKSTVKSTPQSTSKE